MNVEVNKTGRIAYIDALRGFIMLIVVIHHVSLMAFATDSAFEKWSYEFRMPLFFFISGFVMYRSSQIWSIKNTLHFLRKKLPNLIVSPFLFFLVFVYVYKLDLIESLSCPAKVGYWFTFMLFTYFLIYTVSQIVFDKLRMSSRNKDYGLIIIGLFVFLLAYGVSYLFLEKKNFWMGFIGGANLKYFIFFVLGTLVRKHFLKFENMLDSTSMLLCSIIVFFMINVFYSPINGAGAVCRLAFILVSGCTSIVIGFALFRKYNQFFVSNNLIGKTLQIIGSRTLDIYLLHYFFIPRQLGEIFPLFSEHSLPIIEFTCSLVIALLIIAACLGVSAVLRISPSLGRFLFAAKK